MNRFVVVDLETTGNAPKKGDKIIQFAAVVYENGEIIERYSTFLNPEQSIPPFIEQLTGINDEMVKEAPYFEEIAPIIAELLVDSYFVAHNVLFDLSFLQDEMRQAGYEPFLGPVLDTVEMTRFLFPSLNSYRLGGLAEHFNLTHDRPHQADSDAEVTAWILHILLAKLKGLPYVTMKKLLNIAANFTSDLEEIIEEYIQHKEKQQMEDELQYDIHRGIALRKRVEPQKENMSKGQFSYSSVRERFLLELTKNTLFANGEVRHTQLQMMDIVQKAFHGHEHSVIEAGTGLGKTFAYLLPSVIHSMAMDKPVVISTYSIELQHQLIEREIPLLNKLLGITVSAVILKGRSHYISLFRFEELLKEVDDNYDSNLTKAKILVWLTETETGDIDEINLPSGGHFLWERLSTDYLNDKRKNSWESRCFYQLNKQRAEGAHLIVTNHALFCLDLFQGDLLPSYDEMIIDEAHHLEDVVGEFLGRQLDYVSIHYTIGRLGNLDETGVISNLYKNFKKNVRRNHNPFLGFQEKKVFIKEEFDDLFRMLKTYVIEKAKSDTQDTGRRSYSFRSSLEEGSKWNAILECVGRIRLTLGEALHQMAEIVTIFEGNEQSIVTENMTSLFEFIQVRDRFQEWKDSIERLFLTEDGNIVTWIEIEEKGALNSTFLYEQPLAVSDTLADMLFANKNSVVLTSATLTVRNSFNYVTERLGLSDFQPTCVSLSSPFNYAEQAQVLIPTDLPNIKDVHGDDYIQAISTHIAAIAKVTEGRMLVLFTSYDMLKKTYHVVKDNFELEGISLIGQGIQSGSRSKITKNFMQSEQSILFGTSSYWEGVDFPGKTLTCLIMIRLPFTPPNSPLFEARSKQLELQGLNPFTELSLPQAILRFKQGFGRLIRSKKDKGIVFVFDKRIVTTWYGKQFLHSLPDLTIEKGSLPKLLQAVKGWLS